MRKNVKQIESQMAKLRISLEIIEKQLADDGLYSDASRKDELTGLVRQQGQLRKDIEALEWQWLEASEALEAARDPSEDN
jgi:ATP-binding cassette subfamily F protein 3